MNNNTTHKDLDFFKQWNELARLNVGDKVKLTNGDIAEYVRLKQKKFIGVINGSSFDIPVSMFVEVVSKAQAPKESGEYKTLKSGEMFYINKGGNALLFTFSGIEKGNIIGINPISKARTRIDPGMYAGKVSDI